MTFSSLRDCSKQIEYTTVTLEMGTIVYVERAFGSKKFHLSYYPINPNDATCLGKDGEYFRIVEPLDIGCREFWVLIGTGLHRLDGPAIISSDRLEWLVDGEHHRTDGPAIIELDRRSFRWYVDGECRQFNEFCRITNKTDEEKFALQLAWDITNGSIFTYQLNRVDGLL